MQNNEHIVNIEIKNIWPCKEGRNILHEINPSIDKARKKFTNHVANSWNQITGKSSRLSFLSVQCLFHILIRFIYPLLLESCRPDVSTGHVSSNQSRRIGMCRERGQVLIFEVNKKRSHSLVASIITLPISLEMLYLNMFVLRNLTNCGHMRIEGIHEKACKKILDGEPKQRNNDAFIVCWHSILV